MYKIKVNHSEEYQVEKKEEQLLLNEKPTDWSCEPLPDGSFSILFHQRSYRAEVREINRTAKTMSLRIEGSGYELELREPLDEVLQAMGLNERTTAQKINQIRAPMPGMVLGILVSEGQKIGKGEPVLVLEAMKMENVFKSPADAIVKEIRVGERSTVEKGQILMILE